MIDNIKINSFIDSLNTELISVNSISKDQKDEKKRKVLMTRSNIINCIINKLVELKHLND
jgi:hypothetical protein